MTRTPSSTDRLPWKRLLALNLAAGLAMLWAVPFFHGYVDDMFTPLGLFGLLAILPVYWACGALATMFIAPMMLMAVLQGFSDPEIVLPGLAFLGALAGGMAAGTWGSVSSGPLRWPLLGGGTVALNGVCLYALFMSMGV